MDRRDGIAGVLTFLVPGLGQLYCGRWLRAVVLFAVGLVVETATLLVLAHVRTSLLDPYAAAAIWIAWRIGTVTDAVLVARRASGRLGPRWFTSLRTRVVILVLLWIPGALSAAFVLRDHLAGTFRVASRSMSDTLLPGDLLLAVRLSRDPARGDVVVYEVTIEGEPRLFVHRVIGLPGESVETGGTQVRTNGRELEESYVTDEANPELGRFGPAVVPAGHYFLLGDRRSASRDSRFPVVGFIPRERIIGRAEIILISVDPDSGEVRWERTGQVIR